MCKILNFNVVSVSVFSLLVCVFKIFSISEILILCISLCNLKNFAFHVDEL